MPGPSGTRSVALNAHVAAAVAGEARSARRPSTHVTVACETPSTVNVHPRSAAVASAAAAAGSTATRPTCADDVVDARAGPSARRPRLTVAAAVAGAGRTMMQPRWHVAAAIAGSGV